MNSGSRGTLQWLFCFLGLVQVWAVTVAKDPHHHTFLAVSLPKKAQTDMWAGTRVAVAHQPQGQPSYTGVSGKALWGIWTLYSCEALCINTCREAHSPDHQRNQEGHKEALMISLDTKRRGYHWVCDSRFNQVTVDEFFGWKYHNTLGDSLNVPRRSWKFSYSSRLLILWTLSYPSQCRVSKCFLVACHVTSSRWHAQLLGSLFIHRGLWCPHLFIESFKDIFSCLTWLTL